MAGEMGGPSLNPAGGEMIAGGGNAPATMPTSSGPQAPLQNAAQPANWYQQLTEKVGEMGFDDYKKLAGQMMQGSEGGGEEGGPQFPPMPQGQPLGQVGVAGSEYFHSLMRGGGGGRGGLF